MEIPDDALRPAITEALGKSGGAITILPADTVSWHDARTFCEKLSDLFAGPSPSGGYRFSLPWSGHASHRELLPGVPCGASFRPLKIAHQEECDSIG